MKRTVSLEPEAEAICEAAAVPPLIFQLPPAEGRRKLEEMQNTPVDKLPARFATKQVNTGRWGTIPVHIVVPENGIRTNDVIFYIHGGGWVFGSLHTHEKLVRELCARTNSIIVFPEYTRSPEAKYPTAIEQCYRVMCRIPELLKSVGLSCDADTFTVAGDSAGGNIAISMSLIAKNRRGPKIHKLLLYYPVTNACFDTCSYHTFADGYYLYRAGMMWFWNQYTACERSRRQITASPLRAHAEQLRWLPPTMILNGEADVLRDEGEAFACRLREAGAEVTAIRFPAMIHDFVMLNALDQTKACRSAMDASTMWLNRKNREVFLRRKAEEEQEASPRECRS